MHHSEAVPKDGPENRRIPSKESDIPKVRTGLLFNTKRQEPRISIQARLGLPAASGLYRK